MRVHEIVLLGVGLVGGVMGQTTTSSGGISLLPSGVPSCAVIPSIPYLSNLLPSLLHFVFHLTYITVMMITSSDPSSRSQLYPCSYLHLAFLRNPLPKFNLRMSLRLLQPIRLSLLLHHLPILRRVLYRQILHKHIRSTKCI
jgi:hypothetical protein